MKLFATLALAAMTAVPLFAASIVGAGALGTQNTVIPPGSLALGSPARVVRALRPEEDAALDDDAAEYQFLMGQLPEQGGA